MADTGALFYRSAGRVATAWENLPGICPQIVAPAFLPATFARAAAWLGRHESARTGSRGLLTLALYPLRFGLYSPGWFLAAAAGATGLAFGLVWRRRGWRKATAGTVVFSLAFASAGVYYLVMEPATARAAGVDYAEGATYYYTLDHIGRPFNLRDGSQTLRWFEHHYPFGEIIEEEFPAGELSAGAGDYTVTWKPNFRFPGQFQDTDQYPFTQNHYREYLAEYGSYSRIDPISEFGVNGSYYVFNSSEPFAYTGNNPVNNVDKNGLAYCGATGKCGGSADPSICWKCDYSQCIQNCMGALFPSTPVLYGCVAGGLLYAPVGFGCGYGAAVGLSWCTGWCLAECKETAEPCKKECNQ